MLSNSFFLSKGLALLAVGSALYAANPAIGIVTASGHFTLERSQVWGNSTLFDGSVVETEAASSELSLQNGVRMQLGSQSRARVFENHVALEKGVGQIAGPAYEVDAAGLKIRAAGDKARLRIGVGDRVTVTALEGSARVTNSSGVLMASVVPGSTMAFTTQAAETSSLTRTGCLMSKSGKYILQDETTSEVVELTGKDLADNAGNHVQIFGTAAPGKSTVVGAGMMVNVSSTVLKSQGGCLSTASALGASTEPPAGVVPASAGAARTPAPVASSSGGGMSTGAKIAIVGAVVGGAAGAGIALTGSKKSSTSP